MSTSHTSIELKPKSSENSSSSISPIDQAGWIGALGLRFINPLMTIGSKQPLAISDLPALPKSNRPEYLADTFETLQSTSPSTWTYFRLFFSLYWCPMIFGGLLQASGFTAIMSQPFLIKALVAYVRDSHSDESSRNSYDGYIYCALLSLVIIFQSFAVNVAFYIFTRVGEAVRAILLTYIYRKSLRVNSTSFNVGQTVNLMSNDSERVFEACLFLNFTFIGPITIFTGLALMIVQVGASALAGIATLILLIPMQGRLARIMSTYRREMLLSTDQRVKFIGEILRGIRIVKYYAWEYALEKRLEQIRKKETTSSGKVLIYRAITSVIVFVSPVFVATAIFSVYVALGNTLELDQVAVILALLVAIRIPLAVLPLAINGIVEGRISFKRIVEFLQLPEYSAEYLKDQEHVEKGEIQLKQCTIGYPISTEPYVSYVLNDVSVQIPAGSLVALVAPVGGGKTTLLETLLGETIVESGGKVISQGTLAYMNQRTWIRNATVRENITMGQPYDEAKYLKTINAAALEEDFRIFPGGDLCEIGERGVSVSGGQRSRISLARAAYRRETTDIYLLDDPFSAVDLGIGRQMFEKTILGLLQGKTRLIAMNSHLHFLPLFDSIIVLGKDETTQKQTILAQGTYQELIQYHTTLLPQEQENNDDEDEHIDEQSISEIEQKDKSQNPTEQGKLMKSEDRDSGAVQLKTYISYFDAAWPSYGWTAFFITNLFFVLAQLFRIGSDIWVSIWSNGIAFPSQSDTFWVLTYCGWGLLTTIVTFYRSYFFVRINIKASLHFHQVLLRHVFRLPTSTFFDVQPVGRIVNRFARDIDFLDSMIPNFLTTVLQLGFSLVGAALLVAISSPPAIAIVILLSVVFYLIQDYFRKSSRELKRLEALTSSPIFALFEETLQGLSLIRGYKLQSQFRKQQEVMTDTYLRAHLYNAISQRWLAIRLNLISAFLVTGITFLAVAFRQSIDPAIAAISIIYSLSFTGLLQFAVRSFSQVEAFMTSVERIKAYCEEPPEAEYDIPLVQVGTETSHQQPLFEKGEIEFRNLQLRYREDLPLVLKGISCRIKSNEKIGIAGHSGSGKSTLTSALFRLVEAEEDESIFIDGLNIRSLGLKQLRETLAIIPQEAVIFSGTIRSNLDPFETCSDQELWRALEQVHLKQHVSSLDKGLEYQVSEGGGELSHGQRQLICIARAFLRKQAKILVLDEATAAVDAETDRLIQTTIRELFKDKTVLTIAHRLETIADSDRILVLEKGEIAEFNTPLNLLQNETSKFYSIVASSGSNTNYERLLSIAKGQNETEN